MSSAVGISHIKFKVIQSMCVCVCVCVCESMRAFGSHTDPINPNTNVLFSIHIFSFNGYGIKIVGTKLSYSKFSKLHCLLLFIYFHICKTGYKFIQ